MSRFAAPVVVGEFLSGRDAALGKDDHVVGQRAGLWAAHADGAAVAVGLARVVQQVRHVACANRSKLGFFSAPAVPSYVPSCRDTSY